MRPPCSETMRGWRFGTGSLGRTKRLAEPLQPASFSTSPFLFHPSPFHPFFSQAYLPDVISKRFWPSVTCGSLWNATAQPFLPSSASFRPIGIHLSVGSGLAEAELLLSGPHSEASATFLSLIVSPPTNFPPPFYFRSVIWRRSVCLLFSYLFFKLSDLFAQFSTSAAQWNESQFLLTVAWHGRCDSRSCWWETGITQGYTSTPGRGMNCVKSFRWLQSWGLTEILLARARCITDGEAAAQVMHGNYNEQSGGEKTNLLCIFLTFSGGILS